MSPHHAFEPPPLFRDGQMPTAPELILDLLQLRPQPLRDGDTSQPETSLLPLRADVREAEIMPTSAQLGSCRPPRYADLVGDFLVGGGDRADEVGIIRGLRGRQAGGRGRDIALAWSWAK